MNDETKTIVVDGETKKIETVETVDGGVDGKDEGLAVSISDVAGQGQPDSGSTNWPMHEPSVDLGELSFDEIMESIASGRFKNMSFNVKPEDRPKWDAFAKRYVTNRKAVRDGDGDGEEDDEDDELDIDPTVAWEPDEFLATARSTADVLCSHVEMALPVRDDHGNPVKDEDGKTTGNTAAIKFREDVNRLLEQIELEVNCFGSESAVR